MHRLIWFSSLLLFLPLSTANASPPPRQYSLSVAFDLPVSRITGTAETRVEAGEKLTLSTTGLVIDQVTLNGASVSHATGTDSLTINPETGGNLAIRYSAVCKKKPALKTDDTGQPVNVIDEQGISLTGLWYPRLNELASYRLAATLPSGYEAISEADQIQKTILGDTVRFTFHSDHPLSGVTLIASNRYEIVPEKAEGVELYAYFFREDRGLAKTYLDKTKKYLALYEKMLGKYPYRRFSIVENILPTGVSMPGFTAIGHDVLRLSFMPETWLGHEILQQWLGNSVYIDISKGSWAEGLTTYLADQWYEEEAGRGPEYRKQLLLDYDVAVDSENEIALRDFRGGTDPASRAIGYGKCAMVFHMLRRSLGDQSFLDGLRTFVARNQFRRASWDDIRAAFEKQSGRNLGAYFTQWVDRKGLPELILESGTVTRKGDLFETSFGLSQADGQFLFDLPVVISESDGNDDKQNVPVDNGKKTIMLSTKWEPRMLALDKEYDLARKLSDDETPPQIVSLLENRSLLLVPPVTEDKSYATIIAGFKEQGAKETPAERVTREDLSSSSIVVFGRDNPLIASQFGKIEPIQAGFSLIVRKNPWNSRNVIAVIDARSAEEAEKAFPKIPNYGTLSSVAFDQGRVVFQKTEESEQGVLMELREPAAVIDLSTLKTLSAVVKDAADKKIIYAGEFHDKYAHHAVQLQIIEQLYQENQKLAIGMEMFQRPFQKIVDDYIAGTIDERAFLKGTEYFKRWVFDYNLYKPILDFARARKIPVVALNVRKEITDKVAKSGIDSLTGEERKQIPQQLDFSNNEYRERLKAVFDQHKGAGNFDFFYQAQILWDETMAKSVYEFLHKNPDSRMVVIAGGGHLAYGSGIPKRVFRRNSLPYSIVLNDADLDHDIGNFLVLPQPLHGMGAPKLMASLTVEQNRVTVTELPADSVAGKAGIKTGDVIVSMDDEKIQGIEDVKLVLFYKKPGEIVKVRVRRKGFFGTSETDIGVKL